jgi:thiamine-monophosphate kinase
MTPEMDGEFDLIRRLRAFVEGGSGLPAHVRVGSGDDAAVTVPGGATATSVDSLVEGVHFRRETFPLWSVGHKAMAAALSDLAAMGAAPGEAYVQLGVPGDLDVAGAEELADGLGRCATANGAAVLGGDISRAPVLWLGVTVVGHAPGAEELVRRAGAEPGDVLVVTGDLGGAGAGLALLEDPDLEASLDPEVAEALRRRQLEPEPRLAAGRALAAAGVHAMIDLSDGLAGDARHLAAAGGGRLEIELERLPVAPGVEQVAAARGSEPRVLAALAGEDYELLAALPPARLDAAVAAAGIGLTVVGEVVDGAGLVLTQNGEPREIEGFDQMRDAGSPDEPP